MSPRSVHARSHQQGFNFEQPKEQTCGTCGGNGKIRCNVCGGYGQIRDDHGVYHMCSNCSDGPCPSCYGRGMVTL